MRSLLDMYIYLNKCLYLVGIRESTNFVDGLNLIYLDKVCLIKSRHSPDTIYHQEWTVGHELKLTDDSYSCGCIASEITDENYAVKRFIETLVWIRLRKLMKDLHI